MKCLLARIFTPMSPSLLPSFLKKKKVSKNLGEHKIFYYKLQATNAAFGR